jgi:hypothetical protein
MISETDTNPWSKVFLEKPMVSETVKGAFEGTSVFINIVQLPGVLLPSGFPIAVL